MLAQHIEELAEVGKRHFTVPWVVHASIKPCWAAAVTHASNPSIGLSIVQFFTDVSQQREQIYCQVIRAGEIMAIPVIDKRKEYSHYAAHCRYLMTAASDPDSHAIQREMAAEWMKLADAILGPLKSDEII
jgi:hypothetical protein